MPEPTQSVSENRTSQRDLMAAHIRALCQANGIRVLDRAGYGGVAWKRTRTIAIKPVKTQRTYVVALHEIGHIVGRGRSGTRLQQEAAAWAFVIETSVIPLTASTYGRMYVYLRSYLEKARRSRRMQIPAPDQQFWAVYATINERAHNPLAS